MSTTRTHNRSRARATTEIDELARELKDTLARLLAEGYVVCDPPSANAGTRAPGWSELMKRARTAGFRVNVASEEGKATWKIEYPRIDGVGTKQTAYVEGPPKQPRTSEGVGTVKP